MAKTGSWTEPRAAEGPADTVSVTMLKFGVVGLTCAGADEPAGSGSGSAFMQCFPETIRSYPPRLPPMGMDRRSRPFPVGFRCTRTISRSDGQVAHVHPGIPGRVDGDNLQPDFNRFRGSDGPAFESARLSGVFQGELF